MTAAVYGVISFEPKVGRETGFSSVSETQSASGSPVMMSTETPEPGRSTRWASCMAADVYSAADQISADCSGVRMMPDVVRFTSIPAI